MHDESAEKENSESLVPLLGLDGKIIFPVPCRREGGICLDIPFYRTELSECGLRRIRRIFLQSDKKTFQVLG
jgi:hypothetical protein